eukprot:4080348-Amphidinium_carterae.1
MSPWSPSAWFLMGALFPNKGSTLEALCFLALCCTRVSMDLKRGVAAGTGKGAARIYQRLGFTAEEERDCF